MSLKRSPTDRLRSTLSGSLQHRARHRASQTPRLHRIKGSSAAPCLRPRRGHVAEPPAAYTPTAALKPGPTGLIPCHSSSSLRAPAKTGVRPSGQFSKPRRGNLFVRQTPHNGLRATFRSTERSATRTAEDQTTKVLARSADSPFPDSPTDHPCHQAKLSNNPSKLRLPSGSRYLAGFALPYIIRIDIARRNQVRSICDSPDPKS